MVLKNNVSAITFKFSHKIWNYVLTARSHCKWACITLLNKMPWCCICEHTYKIRHTKKIQNKFKQELKVSALTVWTEWQWGNSVWDLLLSHFLFNRFLFSFTRFLFLLNRIRKSMFTPGHFMCHEIVFFYPPIKSARMS